MSWMTGLTSALGAIANLGSMGASIYGAIESGKTAKQQRAQIDQQMQNAQADRERMLAKEKTSQDNLDNGLTKGIQQAQQSYGGGLLSAAEIPNKVQKLQQGQSNAVV